MQELIHLRPCARPRPLRNPVHAPFPSSVHNPCHPRERSAKHTRIRTCQLCTLCTVLCSGPSSHHQQKTHGETELCESLDSRLAPLFHLRLIAIRLLATGQINKLQQAEILRRYEARFDGCFELFLQVGIEVADYCGERGLTVSMSLLA